MGRVFFVLIVVVVLVGGCSYDPSPVGCRFQTQSISPFRVAGVRLNDYGLDSLLADDDSTIIAAIESGECPVEFVQNVTLQNLDSYGTVLLEKFDCFSWITADGKQYKVGSAGITERIGVEAQETGIVCLLISFNAVDVWGSDLSPEEIRDLCIDLGFNDNGAVRDDQHLGRLLVTADIEEDTDHGSIVADSVLIGLDWVIPE